jgi:hypothetical protein
MSCWGGTRQLQTGVVHVVALAGDSGARRPDRPFPFLLIKPSASMAGPFNLGALMPMLEEGSRMAKFLQNLSVFGIWAVFVNAVGLAVLYKKKTAGIFITLLWCSWRSRI